MYIIAVIGGIVAILGIVLIFIWMKQKKKLFTIQAVPKRSLGELDQLTKDISQELGGSGSFKERAKVWGTIETDQPLQAEFSQEPCVWYRSRVTRKYEEEEYEKDSNGNERAVWVTREEHVSDITRDTDFFINDGTGKAKVNLDGCNHETIKVVDEFQPAAGQENHISFGSFSLELSGFSGNSRTLGYTYKEEIIPVNRACLLIGLITDSDSSGILKFRKPQDSDYAYVLSFKSEDDLVESVKRNVQLSRIFAILCIILGLAGVAIGFILPT